MPSLAERAERALLGALLLEPGHFGQMPRLTPEDFRPGEYRRAFGILEPNLASPYSITAAIDPDQQVTLKQSCPDPDHISAYAQMVIEAGLRRTLLAHALRLEHAAGDLHYQAKRLEQVASPGGTAEDMLERPLRTSAGHAEPPLKRLLSHELLVSLSLRAHVQAFDPDRESYSPPAEPGTGSGLVVTSSPAAAWHTAIESSAAPRDEAAGREERVLASLIQRHLPATDLPGWLPADVFTSAGRQEIFAAIVSLHSRGEPVDDLTTDWERARLQTAIPGTAGLDTSYAQRLARKHVGRTEALIACEALLGDYAKPQDMPLPQNMHGPASTARMPDLAPLLPPPSPSSPPGPQPRVG